MEEKCIYIIAQFDEDTNKNLAEIYDKLVQAGMVGEQTKDIPSLGSFDLEHENEVLEHTQAVCQKQRPLVLLSAISVCSA